jgi:hypothetical protein
LSINVDSCHAAQVELEQRLRNRMDMEAELLTLMGSLTDVLHQGHAEADDLAKSVRASAKQAKKVRNCAPSYPLSVTFLATMQLSHGSHMTWHHAIMHTTWMCRVDRTLHG